MAKIEDVDVPSLLWQEGSAPATPASTKWRLYFKTTGLFHKDDAGAEVGPLAAAGGIGTWTDYTPTWAGSGAAPAIGNGSLTGRYKELDGTTLAVHVRLLWGSTTTAGSTGWTFSLPAGYTGAARRQLLEDRALDSGTSYYAGGAVVGVSATVISEVGLVNHTASGDAGLGVPFTWATNDELFISGIIETT